MTAWRPKAAWQEPGRKLYKYACVRCRKCLKRSGFVRNSPEQMPCPECRGPAVRVSYRFQAPRRTDVAQWRKVEALLNQGFRFQPTAIPYPKTRAEVPAFEQWHRRRRLPHES